MASSFKSSNVQATNSLSTAFTVPSGKAWVIIGLRAVNITGSAITFDATLAKDGGSERYITPTAVSIPIADGFSVLNQGDKIVATQNDIIKVRASSNSACDVTISYLEQDQA